MIRPSTALLAVRILIPLALWVVVIAVPVRITGLHAYQPGWCVWFAAVSASSWFVGWAMSTGWQRWHRAHVQ